MGWIVPVVVVIATVAFMEWVAWASHKYIMHGWGWGWHKSHHEETHGPFEMNDLYAVVFAVFAIGLFLAGEWWWRPATWLGIGVTLYGILYFVAHDGLVHKRWPFNYIPRKGYAKRLYQAHRLHHAVEGKEGCVSFGFIWAKPVKTLVKELDQNKRTDRDLVRDVQDGR
ncbi:sterol desaturase family protein [Falsirhodobacter sp. 20TX0035]|uniref:sterol desaturase family protein n=1 Tax=Falsirhodobacter sp. 20TX0035 TaxID=3022019 RepID=UPI00232E1EBB|nr:sterol desaturase family protein [Falsirhodobacter sp. 20TX0035]MDB6452038.1 sterol desaturase family protein [Falsirhodobacter sp. 20TX0035]